MEGKQAMMVAAITLLKKVNGIFCAKLCLSAHLRLAPNG
jgi:hypothetical protein